MTSKLTTTVRLRAALALLLLVFGWLAVPASVTAWESDICGMACCIEEGYCCCTIRRAYVEGQEPEPGEIAFNIKSELQAPCPSGCASSVPSAQIALFRLHPALSPAVDVAINSLRYDWEPGIIHYPFAAQLSSPRAPPCRA